MTEPAEDPSGRFIRTGESSPARTLGRGAPKQRKLVGQILANGVPLLVLLLWWWVAQRASPLEIPSPLAVLERTGSLLFGVEASHTYVSLLRIVLAVVLALVSGALLVTLANLMPVTERLVGNRILPFINSIPALGWAILGVIWFGVGNFAVVFVVTLILLPFTLVNLWEGLRSLDSGLREMGRSFTRSRWRVMRQIEAPMLAPYLLAATRLSFAVGWKVALIAEFFGARSGLGVIMNRARQQFDTPAVFATIAVVVIFVMVVERLVFDVIGKRLAFRAGTLVAGE